MPPSSVPTPDEIWKILKEVSSNQKETSEQIKEMGKQLKKTEGLFNDPVGTTDGKPGGRGFADHPESTGNPD